MSKAKEKPVAPKQPDDFITTSLNDNSGIKHYLQQAFAQDASSMPLMTAAGMVKIIINERAKYVSFMVEFKGRDVLRIYEVGDPSPHQDVGQDSARLNLDAYFREVQEQ